MKKYFKYLFVLLVIGTGAFVLSSCNKDDDNGSKNSSTEEIQSNPFVGAWEWSEKDGNYSAGVSFIFKKDYSCKLYSYEEEDHKYWSETEEGTYRYNLESGVLALKCLSCSDPTCESVGKTKRLDFLISGNKMVLFSSDLEETITLYRQ